MLVTVANQLEKIKYEIRNTNTNDLLEIGVLRVKATQKAKFYAISQLIKRSGDCL